jgi:uncharacterized protein
MAVHELESAVRAHPDGATVTVRVVPRAGVTSIAGAHPGHVRIRVAAPPVDGAANAELAAYLAKGCGVGRGDVEMLRGAHGREKVVLVRGRSPAEVRASLTNLAGGSGR